MHSATIHTEIGIADARRRAEVDSLFDGINHPLHVVDETENPGRELRAHVLIVRRYDTTSERIDSDHYRVSRFDR